MRVTKTSATTHLKKKKFPITENRRLSYNQMTALLQPYEHYFHKIAEPELVYELWTDYVFRTSTSNPKNKRILFASVVIYEKFNAFYFHPLYVDDMLIESLHPSLQNMMTGRTSFHFTELNEQVIALFTDLLKAGFECYRRMGWVRIR
jgi:hypothetical protein